MTKRNAEHAGRPTRSRRDALRRRSRRHDMHGAWRRRCRTSRRQRRHSKIIKTIDEIGVSDEHPRAQRPVESRARRRGGRRFAVVAEESTRLRQQRAVGPRNRTKSRPHREDLAGSRSPRTSEEPPRNRESPRPSTNSSRCVAGFHRAEPRASAGSRTAVGHNGQVPQATRTPRKRHAAESSTPRRCALKMSSRVAPLVGGRGAPRPSSPVGFRASRRAAAHRAPPVAPSTPGRRTRTWDQPVPYPRSNGHPPAQRRRILSPERPVLLNGCPRAPTFPATLVATLFPMLSTHSILLQPLRRLDGQAGARPGRLPLLRGWLRAVSVTRPAPCHHLRALSSVHRRICPANSRGRPPGSRASSCSLSNSRSASSRAGSGAASCFGPAPG